MAPMLILISVLFRMWEMVLKMSNEIVAPNPGTDGAKHRTSVAISKAIICRAKAYLESAFLKFVKNTVFANLQKAQLGGVPGTYHLVRSFLNVKISPHTPGLEDGLVDGKIFFVIFLTAS
jgi:nuclear pore complex protein Nup93